MDWLNTVMDFIVQQLAGEFVAVVAGFLAVKLGEKTWVEWKYGKWRVVILDTEGKRVLDRKISAGKVREIQAEPSDKAVFLKGVVSPYGMLNCDIIEKGPELELLVEDKEKREFRIDLSKNPPSSRGQATPTVR